METTLSTDAVKFLEVAESLPIEMRLAIIDRLLETVQPTDPEVDRLWLAEVKRRSEDLRSGKVKPIPGDVFLKEAHEKLVL